MNRRNFFKNVSATIIGVIIFPGVVVKAVSTTPGFNIKEIDERIKQLKREWHIREAKEIYRQHLLQYPLTTDECYKKKHG